MNMLRLEPLASYMISYDGNIFWVQTWHLWSRIVSSPENVESLKNI